MPLTWRILLALLCGLGAGLFVATLDLATSTAVTSIAAPIGTVGLDGLRMAIIPLVFGLVVIFAVVFVARRRRRRPVAFGGR
jgi:Na+/H+-dicarboxylate symporter